MGPPLANVRGGPVSRKVLLGQGNLPRLRSHSHHGLGLLEELVFGHGALLDHLNSDVILPLPFAQMDHSELAASQLLQQRDVVSPQFPDS